MKSTLGKSIMLQENLVQEIDSRTIFCTNFSTFEIVVITPAHKKNV